MPWSCPWLGDDGCRVTRFAEMERAFHEQKDKRDIETGTETP